LHFTEKVAVKLKKS